MSEASPATAVIRAEPDGYDRAKVKLMGRQSAGHGFLRAAVQARGDRPIYGFTPSRSSAERFRSLVRSLDPAAPFEWIGAGHLARVRDIGVLYTPTPDVASHARLRLRAGLASFSVCGVTHTTASLGVMDDLIALLREAVAPWDALVCTSAAVVETVRRLHEAEADYLRWRFGHQVRLTAPQLPLIPLGVHCEDYAIGDAQRATARRELGLGTGDVAGLFVGRLVYHAKAHPYPMLRGFQLAAERAGKPLALILSGWFPNATIEAAFRAGAQDFAPDVRVIFLDGRDAAQRDRAWAAADLFVSLSDNIQETFGLTPIEAMAAGLPVVASDWNGYRDTVRHEVDGIRVRTFAPAAGMGEALAQAYKSGTLDYDHYCWSAASSTAVEVAAVADAVTALARDPALRRRMGEAGRRRAREVFDWPVIYRQYQALWAELNARRRAAEADPDLKTWIEGAPRASSAALDPFHAFGHYPTTPIDSAARLSLAPDATRTGLATALDHPLFLALATRRTVIEALFVQLQSGDLTVAEAAQRLRITVATTARAAGLLAKLGMAGTIPD